MDIEWPTVDRQGWLDRRVRTQNIINDLAANKSLKILEVHHFELQEYCKQNGHEYTHTHVTDGKIDVTLKGKMFDIIYIGFVLHAQADNTLNLLHQLKRVLRGYMMIGEDLASPGNNTTWHKRNFEKCPHGVFRGDREWKCIFELFRMRLQARYIIRRQNDPDTTNVHRCIYLLRCIN